MNIIFYDNLSKKNVVNKTLSEKKLTLSIFIKKDSFNPLMPILYLSNVDKNSIGNYCFIEEINRYYFINNIEIIKNNLIKLELETDYLYTFKTEILKGSGIVKESKNIDNYVSDYDVLDTTQQKTISFPKNLFTSENHLYLTGVN